MHALGSEPKTTFSENFQKIMLPVGFEPTTIHRKVKNVVWPSGIEPATFKIALRQITLTFWRLNFK